MIFSLRKSSFTCFFPILDLQKYNKYGFCASNFRFALIYPLGNAALLLVVPFRENRHHEDWLPLVTIYQIIASAEVFVCIISTSVYLGW